MSIGVIGGTGFYEIPEIVWKGEWFDRTPYGYPSDPIREGEFHGKKVFFLPRHGKGHRFLPSEVPYTANFYALKILGVKEVLSLSAVGSLREELSPGTPVLPHQFIDRTYRRKNTFFGEGVVSHVSMADPVCPSLLDHLYEAVKEVDPKAVKGGTYICIEGPQFSTRAESILYQKWGADLVGMTNATEAKVAREAGICYVTLCFVTDYDCWKVHEKPVTVEEVVKVLNKNVEKGREILRKFLARYTVRDDCSCRAGGKESIITVKESIPPHRVKELEFLL